MDELQRLPSVDFCPCLSPLGRFFDPVSTEFRPEGEAGSSSKCDDHDLPAALMPSFEPARSGSLNDRAGFERHGSQLAVPCHDHHLFGLRRDGSPKGVAV